MGEKRERERERERAREKKRETEREYLTCEAGKLLWSGNTYQLC